MSTLFRPKLGRVLCGALWLLCAYAAIATVRADGFHSVVTVYPWLALLAVLAWALYWRPQVEVDDAGVHLVNVLRTIDVPWPAIQRVDTKWALCLFTEYGNFTAWAAPAPGGLATLRAERPTRRALPESAISDGISVRPGDLPGTPSGSAALLVRRRFEELRDAGYLDNPRLEFATVPVRWHWPVIGAVIVLIVLCGASLLLG